VVALLAAPLVATAGIDILRHYDWNFLLQKCAVLVVWALTFAAAYTLIRMRPSSAPRLRLAAGPLAMLLLYHAVGRVDATTIDRYAAVDPSLRLVRDAQTTVSGDTA